MQKNVKKIINIVKNISKTALLVRAVFSFNILKFIEKSTQSTTKRTANAI